MNAIVARRSFDALRVTLALVLLTYVWRIQDLIPGIAPLKLPTIATGGAIVLLLFDGSAQHHLFGACRHRIGQLITLFALAAVVSAVASIDVGWSLSFLAKGLVPALALAIVVPAGVFIAGDATMFAALQVAGAVFYCCAILTRFQVGPDGRLGSLVFYDGNDIGMLLVCTLPLCAYFARHASRGVLRMLSVGAAVLFVFTIAKTGSRGAFLGLVTVGAYVVLRFQTVRPSTRLAVVGLSGCLLLAGATTKYWSLMDTILHPTQDYNWAGNSDSGRMSIWARGIGYAEDRPLTGVGAGAFNIAEGTISPLARRQEYGQGLKWSSPHNSFVQVLAEFGFPGFALFLAILFYSYRTATRLARASLRRGSKARRRGELSQAHAAALAGYVVSGFFLSQAYAPYLYFVIGMIIGLDRTVRAEWRADDAELDAQFYAMQTEEAVLPAPDPASGSLVWS
ncbi:MAG TPA: O-antigen ligase family protein [Gemmatimonadaceae bacterium]